MKRNDDRNKINKFITTEILVQEQEQKTQKFTKHVFQMLNRYATIIHQLDPFYKRTSEILLAMDALYVATYANVGRATLAVQAGKMKQHEVQQEKNELATMLIDLEAEYRENREQLDALIGVLQRVRKDNVQEFLEKNDEISYLFMTIYSDIEDLYNKYDKLIRKAKRK